MPKKKMYHVNWDMIEKRRTEENLTMGELSKLIGKAETYYSKSMRNNNGLPKDSILSIAELLEISPRELTYRDAEEEAKKIADKATKEVSVQFLFQEIGELRGRIVQLEKKIEEIRWWDYDGNMKSQGVYYMDAKKLAFSIKVDEKTTDKLYYAFYYSKDENFTTSDLGEAEKSDNITPSYYKDGTAYYNIECEKNLKPGHYCVIVSSDKSFSKPYAVAYAKILDEKNNAD